MLGLLAGRSDHPRRGRDKRRAPRLKTRLRLCRLFSVDGTFLIECLMQDRSEIGAGLRLLRDVPVPGLVQLHDDLCGTIRPARTVWRRGQDMGIHFTGDAVTAGRPAPTLPK